MDESGEVETVPAAAPAATTATGGRVASGVPEPSTDDVDPVESVFRAEYRRLVALARVLLDHQTEAEEVVQEAFARVLGARRPPAPGALVAYIERTVVNLCRDGLRRRAVIRRVPPLKAESGRPAEVVVLGSAEQQQVVQAVRALPRRQRECVALRHLLGHSTSETAAVLGISEGSVKTHLSRGMAALEHELEDWR